MQQERSKSLPPISSGDFYEWKENPVTNWVYYQLENTKRDIEEKLGRTAGADPVQDRYLVGMVLTINQILNLDYEGVIN